MSSIIPPSSSASAPQGLPPDLRKLATRKLIGIYLGLALSVMAMAIILAIASPFHKIESCLYLLLITSPALVLILIQGQGFIDRQQQQLQSISKKPVWPHMAATVIALMLAFLTIDVGLLYNRFGDLSEAVPTRAMAQSKYLSYGKYHRVYYNARIKHPVESPLPVQFTETESILLHQSEYNRVIEGESEIELLVHKGALGLPWYERGHDAVRVVGKVAADVPPVATQPLPQTTVTEGLLREACLWKKNFNLNREIPPLVPTGYHRDFWPNGAPRSVEPQVNGRNHGIGHYTFANGAVYADIPWKDGKKHGVFTLYREDGTKEQELSYFQGQLFGVQQWFDAQGRLDVEYLYIDDATPLMSSRCNGVVR